MFNRRAKPIQITSLRISGILLYFSFAFVVSLTMAIYILAETCSWFCILHKLSSLDRLFVLPITPNTQRGWATFKNANISRFVLVSPYHGVRSDDTQQLTADDHLPTCHTCPPFDTGWCIQVRLTLLHRVDAHTSLSSLVKHKIGLRYRTCTNPYFLLYLLSKLHTSALNLRAAFEATLRGPVFVSVGIWWHSGKRLPVLFNVKRPIVTSVDDSYWTDGGGLGLRDAPALKSMLARTSSYHLQSTS